jgi:signal transduction histidine kinase
MWRGGHEELFHYDAAFIVVGERGANEDILEKLEEVAATLPVILILPESDQDFANSALRTGAQDCLVSAELDSDTLMRSLHHATARNRNRMGLKLAESEQRLQAFRESQAFYHSLVETLRAVSNYVQLLERHYGDLLDGEGKRFIGFAVDGAKRMRQLINDLLAFSRIGTRGKKLAPIDSGAALSRALKSLALVIEEDRSGGDD